MIEICNRGDFVKAQTCRSVFVCRSRGQADHPAEREVFEPITLTTYVSATLLSKFQIGNETVTIFNH